MTRTKQSELLLFLRETLDQMKGDLARIDDSLHQAEALLHGQQDGTIGTAAAISSALARIKECRLLLGVKK